MFINYYYLIHIHIYIHTYIYIYIYIYMLTISKNWDICNLYTFRSRNLTNNSYFKELIILAKNKKVGWDMLIIYQFLYISINLIKKEKTHCICGISPISNRMRTTIQVLGCPHVSLKPVATQFLINVPSGSMLVKTLWACQCSNLVTLIFH